MKNSFFNNPYLLYSPFLVLLILFVLKYSTNQIWGDEGYYLLFANNLLNGFYSPPAPDISLHYGPGYPLILAPFVAFNAPHILIKLVNPVFYFLSIIFLHKTLILVVNKKLAVIGSLFWALYYEAYYFMHRMHSEIFVAFLIVLLVYTTTIAFRNLKQPYKDKNIYFAGFLFGFIALTKVIFGYVILVILTGTIFFRIINKDNQRYKRAFAIAFIALITTAPYLAYTYKITNRLFYWGTTGGNNLYWLTNPSNNEYGMWLPDPDILDTTINKPSKTDLKNLGQLGTLDPFVFIPGAQDSVNLKHQEDFKEIKRYTGLERDDILKKMAIRNIKEHPIIFAKNCFCNIGRIIFNYPNAYMLQKPTNLVHFFANGIIVVFLIFCTIIFMINWNKTLFQIRFLFLISIIYLGGSVLGSAENRMFTIIVPFFIHFIAYTIQNSLHINYKFKPDFS